MNVPPHSGGTATEPGADPTGGVLEGSVADGVEVPWEACDDGGPVGTTGTRTAGGAVTAVVGLVHLVDG